MRNVTTNLIIAAAAFVGAAGMASAQTMEAKIPFAFRASGKVLAPGTYEVRMLRGPSGVHQFVIRSEGNGAVLTVAFNDGNAKKAWTETGNGVLSFECGVSRCALHEIWTGIQGTPVYQVPAPSLGKDEPVRTAEIALQPAKTN